MHREIRLNFVWEFVAWSQNFDPFIVPLDRFLVFLAVYLLHVVVASSRRSVRGAARKTASEKKRREGRRGFFALYPN